MTSSIFLHQQCEDGNAGRRYGQKPLPDSRDEMNGIHVFTPLTELIEQATECAARQRTTNGLFDQLLSKA